MFTLITVVHVLTALFLILFVLLQDPKGGGAFGIGGGASAQTIFGSTGASNFLGTVTKWLAITFAATSITLSYLTETRGTSAMEGYVAPVTASPTTETPNAEKPTDAKSEKTTPEQKK
jgi:preprotein translocase subunit SecG